MSSLVHDVRRPSRSPAFQTDLPRAALALIRAVAGWPFRVAANRKLLHQMAGMSACELADIGLTSADLRDSTALPLRAEIGQFLASRVTERRDARHSRRR